jgi:hypothetical protein
VFAKVPIVVDGKPKQRVTAFIVDAHAPGIALGKIEEKMGIVPRRAFLVSGPTTPSTSIFASRWKAVTAADVAGPYSPSTGPGA